MAPRKKKTDDAPKREFPLLDALEFAAPVFADAKEWPHTHVKIAQGWLYASNGVVTIGYPMPGGDASELFACVEGARMLAAVRRCGGAYSLTQTDAALSVKAGTFRASVPAADARTYPECISDWSLAPCGEPVRVALQTVEPWTLESDARVVCSSVLLHANSCVATDGIQCVEKWHGYDLPPDLVLPKKGVATLCKAKSEFVGFGFSSGSITIWLANGAWIKVQRYQAKYVDYNRLFPECEARAITEGVFAGVKTIADFDSCVQFSFGEMSAFNDTASVECHGLPDGIGFDAKRFLNFEPHATSFAFMADKAVFFGDGFRGVLMARRKT